MLLLYKLIMTVGTEDVYPSTRYYTRGYDTRVRVSILAFLLIRDTKNHVNES